MSMSNVPEDKKTNFKSDIPGSDDTQNEHVLDTTTGEADRKGPASEGAESGGIGEDTETEEKQKGEVAEPVVPSPDTDGKTPPASPDSTTTPQDISVTVTVTIKRGASVENSGGTNITPQVSVTVDGRTVLPVQPTTNIEGVDTRWASENSGGTNTAPQVSVNGKNHNGMQKQSNGVPPSPTQKPGIAVFLFLLLVLIVWFLVRLTILNYSNNADAFFSFLDQPVSLFFALLYLFLAVNDPADTLEDI